MSDERHQARLEHLRTIHHRPDPDLSLGFLHDQFKRQVERPYKQLGVLISLWFELVPEPLARHTRLEGLSRGVLRVVVDSSARLYELDRLLRQGMFHQLVSRQQGPAIRRVKLRLGPC